MKKYAKNLKKYCRLADYIGASQIYLRDNVLLERKLKKEDIKPRLLGHWGTVPGINLIYGTLNIAIKENPDFDFMYIVGPGHGYPGYQAGVFIDGSLSHFYPDKVPYSKDGLKEVVYKFSVPYGFPSHLNPESPGVILEGGELGYSLSVAYGAALDSPELIVATLVGDGESETGPLSGAWQLNRFLNPARDGAVLPILHLNNYKISGPTIFSSFSKKEIMDYFKALHYDPIYVDYDDGNLHEDILSAMEKAISKIKLEKSLARKNNLDKPRPPMIILKTPKGMGAPKSLNGIKIEGNSASHQVVFKNPKSNDQELEALESWLKSYKVEKLVDFDERDGSLILDSEIEAILPEDDRSLGRNIYARRGAQKLSLPGIYEHLEKLDNVCDISGCDTMQKAGIYMRELFKENPGSFRLFSPDETYSNHLQEVFKVSSRAWQWPVKPWEKDLSKDGRVMELLSEHELFGMMQGYTLTGRYGFFVSYEAFAEIVSSMMEQYLKFIKFARKVPWRDAVPSMNVILSSLLERQDHNGFSHQSPSFVAAALDKDLDLVNVYYPADQNVMMHTLEEVLDSRNKLNIIVAGKHMKNLYLDMDEARRHVHAGASIWEDFSEDDPHAVIATVGDYVTRETIEAVKIFKNLMPHVRLRFVNFNKLDILAEEDKSNIDFLLTPDKPVLFNYHGYPSTLKKLLFGVVKYRRVIINGYREIGSTTTPFDMLMRNGISRFDTVKDLATLLKRYGQISYDEHEEINLAMNRRLKEAKDYATNHFDDLPELKFED